MLSLTDHTVVKVPTPIQSRFRAVVLRPTNHSDFFFVNKRGRVLYLTHPTPDQRDRQAGRGRDIVRETSTGNLEMWAAVL